MRRIGQAGQHQVHDVLGEVVLARADENLVAGDLVGAVSLRFGLGAQQAQVGAAVRLGQAHGAGPFTAGELGQIELLLLVRAIGVQRFVCAMRQAGVHGPRLVGAVEHFVQRRVHHERQALTAVVGVARQRWPAAFHELLVGLLEALGRRHLVGALVERAALFVAADVEREGHVGGELAGLFQHRVHGVGVDFGIRLHLLVVLGDLEDLMHEELHVAKRWRVGGHVNSGVRMKCGKESVGNNG
ncbi:hypothetical protein SDC9_157293 [bioreactor metagenome]|uniref:Uncharacterized protein n=1 Tax=bioreactor metagenome TaxID=1076179 RepID=A0A645F7X1_9ZZZZ